ncbi:MAG: hypothetical protein K0Q52_186 [Microbacterium sp.]|jgi:hypothetical protein|nr:hypothetical protein [Microbacterium sp.]
MNNPTETPARPADSFALSAVEVACGVTLDAVVDARARGTVTLDGTGTRFTAPANVSPAVAGAAARMTFGERGEFVGMDGVGQPVYRVDGVHPLMVDADPVPAATPAPVGPRTYTATRIAARYFEYVGEDDATPGDTFNVDATPHRVEDDALEFDTMAELVAAVRRDGVRFDATGTDWAANPDHSYVIDYATGEREAVSWHFDAIPPALLARVIMPAVDAN